eukprot:Rmarinus@m.17774
MRLAVLYGSQTGCSEGIARIVHEKISKIVSSAELSTADAFPKESLAALSYLILICSSTGDGDPPENMSKLYRYIKRKTHPTNLLQGVRYALLGLGDTNYSTYQGVPRTVDKNLSRLGAVSFYKRGEADEAMGLDSVVDPWIDGLPAALTLSMSKGDEPTIIAEDSVATHTTEATATVSVTKPSTESADFTPELTLPPLLPCRIVVDMKAATDYESEAAADRHVTFAGATTPVWNVPIKHVEKLTKEGALGRVWSMVLDITGLDWEYQPGDAFGLICPNPPGLVSSLLRHLDLNAEDMISLRPAEEDASAGEAGVSGAGGVDGDAKPAARGSRRRKGASGPTHVRSPCLVGEAFERFVDITSPVSKAALRAFAEHTPVLEEKQKLLFLSSREGRDAYMAEVVSGRMGFVRLLDCFPSVRPPLSVVLDLLPPLQPRFFSVASCQAVTPHEVSFAFSVVDSDLPSFRSEPLPTRFQGVCTTYLDQICETLASKEGLAAGSGDYSGGDGDATAQTVRIFKRPTNSFHLPEDDTVPVILIGPGTGVAPFRGFILDRSRKAKEGVNVGDVWLFFGCRSQSLDFLYGDELLALEKELPQLKITCAFSRDQDHKVYVQDRMEEHRLELAQWLLERSACVYVCGDGSRMARQVHEKLVSILNATDEPTTTTDTEKMLREWTKQKRYLKDVWS